MTDEAFKDLVNLYLDREISAVEMELLQSEITHNPERRREFENACRLHAAMSQALSVEVARNEAKSPLFRVRALFYSGMAASFVLGGVLLAPIFKNGSHDAEVPISLSVLDPTLATELPRARSLRVVQLVDHTQSRQCGSIAAQLRLLGLQPSMAPVAPLVPVRTVEPTRVVVKWDEVRQGWRYDSEVPRHAPQSEFIYRRPVYSIGGPFEIEDESPAVSSVFVPVGFRLEGR